MQNYFQSRTNSQVLSYRGFGSLQNITSAMSLERGFKIGVECDSVREREGLQQRTKRVDSAKSIHKEKMEFGTPNPVLHTCKQNCQEEIAGPPHLLTVTWNHSLK